MAEADGVGVHQHSRFADIVDNARMDNILKVGALGRDFGRGRGARAARNMTRNTAVQLVCSSLHAHCRVQAGSSAFPSAAPPAFALCR
jgi:hypothetical protein